MGRDQIKAALDIIGWTPAVLARQVGVDKQQVRRWLTGVNKMPELVAAWLLAVADFHCAHPAPPALVKPPRKAQSTSKNVVDSPQIED